MKNISIFIFFSSILVTTLAAEVEKENRDRIHSVRKVVDNIGKINKKEVSIVDNFRHMFIDGKVSGQVKTIYASYDYKELGVDNSDATAFGGIIKYELAEFNGFNAAAAVYTSHDVHFATGSDTHHNTELSSSQGSYTDMAEAYINYKYNDFNFRAGRQTLDTPLADSDDIRMIQNTFEAYIATYKLMGVELLAGNIQAWQGFDADLDEGWVALSKNGANFGGISYSELFELNLWFYNIQELTNALYMDVGLEYNIEKNTILHFGVQYLSEKEIDSSNIAADIYGGLLEFVFHDVGFNFAFNHALKNDGKASFSGTGGGTMYTSMDTMIIDEIANDREVLAYVFGVSYSIEYFGFLYAHGDFIGEEDSHGQKAHVLEHDIGFSYDVNDEFLVSAIYVVSKDEENNFKSEYDYERVQVMVNYNF